MQAIKDPLTGALNDRRVLDKACRDGVVECQASQLREVVGRVHVGIVPPTDGRGKWPPLGRASEAGPACPEVSQAGLLAGAQNPARINARSGKPGPLGSPR